MNQRPLSYGFQRYLAAKRTVDDRALNRHVWESLHSALHQLSNAHPPTILEIGGGIGTMVERLLDEGRLQGANYHLLDEQPDNILVAGTRLKARLEALPSKLLQNGVFQITAAESL